MELDWEGRTPKHKASSKVGAYLFAGLFLSGLSWVILYQGGGWIGYRKAKS